MGTYYTLRFIAITGYEPSDNGCIGEDIRGRCTTSIMIQRNSQDEITTIFRRDNSCSPNAIFTLDDTCTSPIKSETSSSPLTRATVVHVYTQTDSVEATCDKCSLADKKLRELCAKLEEAKIKNDEQVIIRKKTFVVQIEALFLGIVTSNMCQPN